MLNPPTKWQKFWRWIDQDFNDPRPLSAILFVPLAMVPIGIAFLLQASAAAVETAKFLSIGILILFFAYYCYRMAKNMARYFRNWDDL